MDENMKENIKTTLYMDSERFFITTVTYTMGNGKLTKNQEMAPI